MLMRASSILTSMSPGPCGRDRNVPVAVPAASPLANATLVSVTVVDSPSRFQPTSPRNVSNAIGWAKIAGSASVALRLSRRTLPPRSLASRLPARLTAPGCASVAAIPASRKSVFAENRSGASMAPTHSRTPLRSVPRGSYTPISRRSASPIGSCGAIAASGASASSEMARLPPAARSPLAIVSVKSAGGCATPFGSAKLT